MTKERPTARSWRERYGIALLATAAGLLGTAILLAVISDPIYAPLTGAVLLSAWLGGVGPAAVSLTLGWGLALWLIVEPRASFRIRDGEDMTRWGVNLAVAALIVIVAAFLRISRQRAREAAFDAETSLGRVGALQELSAQLAHAASSTDVSHALAERASALLDAQGSTLGLLERDDVLVVDPIGIATSFYVPRRRISFDDRTALTAAVREGRIVRADDRAAIEREFPDSAAVLPPVVRSVLAVPLRVAGKPIGVVEFLFDRPHAVDDELEAVATTAAGLAELSLERARLYEREREMRTALDRILQVAPRLYADTAEEVTAAICREARATFGADYGVLWAIRDDVLELVRSDPGREEWPEGLRVPLANFPGLEQAVKSLGISFVPDVLDEARREGLERVRQLGIRSSLRSPIAVGGQAAHVLVVSWQRVIDEPDPATIAIIRRFADQAGLALEHLERRRAEALAAARADESDRLRAQSERRQRMTARLSNAVTEAEVADVVVDAAFEGAAASAAHVYGVHEERQVARRLATRGDGKSAPIEVSLEDDSDVARAARQRIRWQELPELSSPAEQTSLVVPLVSGRRTVGVLELEWSEPVTLAPNELAYLETLLSPGAQALDRARHFESERSIAETLQRSVLPVSLPRLPGVQLAARYLPGTQEVDVGGDWFDAVELSDGRVGLVVGDVVGKGVHAAASMGQLRNALRAISIEKLKPPSALARLDRLASDALDTSFATVVYAIVDTNAGVLRFSSAGHPPPVVAYPDGRVELLEDGRGLPLGTGLNPKYRQSVVELPAGSVVVLYSDGLVERRGHTIDEGIDRLVTAIGAAPKDSERLLEHVLDRLVAGADRADDIAILAARFLPVAPRPLDLTLSCGEGSLHLVRDAIRTWLAGTELPRTDAEDLVLAVWEVCTNAIEHAANPVEDTVRVRASVDDSCIRCVVDDTGRFVPVTSRPNRGLGLRLAQHLTSSLDITTTRGGTTVALEKRLPKGDELVREARREAR